MVKVPLYLHVNRFGIFYFRMAMPIHLRVKFNKHEIRRSLRTRDKSEAIIGAQKLHLYFDHFFKNEVEAMHHTSDNRLKMLRIGKIKVNSDGDLEVDGVEIDQQNTNEDAYQREMAFLNEMLASIQGRQQALPTRKKFVPDLSLVIEEYCQEKILEDSWLPKTESENRAIYDLLLKIIPDKPIDTISYQEAKDVKTVLFSLPCNINKNPLYRTKTLEQIRKMAIKDTLSKSTISKYMGRYSSLFGWAKKQHYVDENCFEKLSPKKNRSPHEERKAFEPSDLDKLFSSEIFTKGKYLHSYYYWLPLLGLYTGARINELCQLHLKDIKQIDGIWVISINSDAAGKRVKTPSGKRLIPLHPILITLDFINHVDGLGKNNEKRLFPELKLSRDGYGQAASKWFRRYRIKCGVTEEGKVFHSFRHTFSNWLVQDNTTNHKIISALEGHADSSVTTGRYAKPYNPMVLYEAICKIKYRPPFMNIS
jgi:integrase